MTRHAPALDDARRLADELLDLLGAVRRRLVDSEAHREELARRVGACELELAELTSRVGAGAREGAPAGADAAGAPPPAETSGLGEGELRRAIAAARGPGTRRPRWPDHLLGAPR